MARWSQENTLEILELLRPNSCRKQSIPSAHHTHPSNPSLSSSSSSHSLLCSCMSRRRRIPSFTIFTVSFACLAFGAVLGRVSEGMAIVAVVACLDMIRTVSFVFFTELVGNQEKGGIESGMKLDGLGAWMVLMINSVFPQGWCVYWFSSILKFYILFIL